jgi:transcriptional regulator of aromatic amino acid metabolism
VLECEDAEGLYEQANGCVTYTDGIKEISETTYNELMNFLGAY